MNWEETIIEIRNKQEFNNLVKDAYFGEDLKDNIIRFRATEEFKETLKEVRSIKKEKNIKILDIGSGNGISAVAFALEGFEVVALEPDPSETIGAGAIRKSKSIFDLNNLTIVEAWGEKLPFKDHSFEIVYGRQVMHHALDLTKFVSEAARVLKTKGIFMTVRDHVVKDHIDKEKFLKRHPLHKFYGGENAFTLVQYVSAIEEAPLKIIKSLDASSSSINYAPWNKKRIKEKFGYIGSLPFVSDILFKAVKIRLNKLPGRLHSFIAIKE